MQQEQIHLERVTEDNVEAIVKLRVSKKQKDYAASSKRSLIDAYLALAEDKPVFPFGIYSGKTPVGFVMLTYDDDRSGDKRNQCNDYCHCEAQRTRWAVAIRNPRPVPVPRPPRAPQRRLTAQFMA